MSASEYKNRLWGEFWCHFYYDLFPESKWGHTVEFEMSVGPNGLPWCQEPPII